LFVRKKVVPKKGKNGEVEKYVYYDLVESFRKNGEVKTRYITYLGKEPTITKKKAHQQGLSLAELEKIDKLTIKPIERENHQQ
jgi:hypothetical protein